MRRDTRRRLEEAGSAPVPELDPAFAQSLGERLEAAARAASRPAGAGDAEAAVEAGAPSTPSRGRRRPAWVGAALGVGLVAVVLFGLASLGRDRVAPARPSLELTAAVNVVVQLADGTIVDDPDGLLLPEGAIVTVGAGGSATIGGTQLGPGERAVIREGAVVVQQAASNGHSGATAPPQGAPSASSTVTARPSASTSAGAPTATPAQSSTPAPSGSPTDAPSPPPTRSPSASPSPTPSPIPRPRLAASLLDPATISVDWSRTPGAKQYVLVITRSKTGTAPRPQYPGSRLQLVFARPPLAPMRLKVPDGVVQVKLMVVALDANGVELARSRVARIDIPVLVPIGTPSVTTSPADGSPADASAAPTPS